MATSAAWAALEQMLKNYGLGELTTWAKQQFVDGRSPDEITLALEDQPAFKQKYKAIFDRRAKGLPPVSVADIMQYRQQALNLEHFYGLPQGVVSDDAHVNAFVAGDTSFDELTHRIQQGALIAQQSPPEVKQWLAENYGINDGALTAFFVDPIHAMPYIDKVATSALLGGAATRQGFGNLTADEAGRLALAGVSTDQANQGFGQLAQSKELLDPLAGAGDSAIGRDTQLGLVEGDAASVAALQKRARERTAGNREGGAFAGKGLVSGTSA